MPYVAHIHMSERLTRVEILEAATYEHAWSLAAATLTPGESVASLRFQDYVG
jgi:hypothetical protein